VTTNPSSRQPQDTGDVLRTRAGRPAARANLRCLGYSATIAIALAGCAKAPPQELARAAAERAKQSEDIAFRECIDEVVGAFSAASIEVVKECRAHAKEVAGTASAIEARRAETLGSVADESAVDAEGSETPKGHIR
jgi:hypothetical protein